MPFTELPVKHIWIDRRDLVEHPPVIVVPVLVKVLRLEMPVLVRLVFLYLRLDITPHEVEARFGCFHVGFEAGEGFLDVFAVLFKPGSRFLGLFWVEEVDWHAASRVVNTLH